MNRRLALLGAFHQTPRGDALRAVEEQLLLSACEDVFGQELLQLGTWGGLRFGAHAAQSRHLTVATESPDADVAGALRCRLTQLPIANGAVDAVLLPHSLETHATPHDLLREADRVLRGEGQLLILGFAPWRPWALRRVPGLRRTLRAARVRDWLALLGYEVPAAEGYLHCGPYASSVRALLRRAEDGWTPIAPWPSGAWLLKARKRVYGVTPLRLRRRERQTLVSIVKPTARDPAESP